MNTKYKSPFVFEVFDTRNTSTEREIPIVGKSVRSAREAARRLSIKYHKVIVYLGSYQSHDWEQYEKGEKTEWSYPDGLPVSNLTY